MAKFNPCNDSRLQKKEDLVSFIIFMKDFHDAKVGYYGDIFADNQSGFDNYIERWEMYIKQREQPDFDYYKMVANAS